MFRTKVAHALVGGVLGGRRQWLCTTVVVHRSESGGGSGGQVVKIKNKLLHAIDLYHLGAYLSYNGSM